MAGTGLVLELHADGHGGGELRGGHGAGDAAVAAAAGGGHQDELYRATGWVWPEHPLTEDKELPRTRQLPVPPGLLTGSSQLTPSQLPGRFPVQTEDARPACSGAPIKTLALSDFLENNTNLPNALALITTPGPAPSPVPT